MNYNIFGGIFIQVRSSKEALKLLKASGQYLNNAQAALTPDGQQLSSGQQDGQQDRQPHGGGLQDGQQDRQPHGGGLQDGQQDGQPCGGGRPDKETQADNTPADKTQADNTQADGTLPPRRFAYISDTAVQNNVADLVERSLVIAAHGTASQLMTCIREEEMKGNLTTQNLSSRTLYYELKKHFHLNYKYRNFAKARH